MSWIILGHLYFVGSFQLIARFMPKVDNIKKVYDVSIFVKDSVV